ncbi:hypothetical protein EC9_37970 [Rosistilla ulvae]|uniref:Uncharacterized protein n=1 Tax=Rosistilla ulvae TaxID=1930277 RepID=A0A517M405_9BACT|nr:hypothetical protein EC9_37970 [Rosistilla ulvae]
MTRTRTRTTSPMAVNPMVQNDRVPLQPNNIRAIANLQKLLIQNTLQNTKG